jgi:hypothetical protein
MKSGGYYDQMAGSPCPSKLLFINDEGGFVLTNSEKFINK